MSRRTASIRAYPCAHHGCDVTTDNVTDHMIHASTHLGTVRRVERPVSCWRCAAYLTVTDGVIERCECGFQHPGWSLGVEVG